MRHACTLLALTKGRTTWCNRISDILRLIYLSTHCFLIITVVSCIFHSVCFFLYFYAVSSFYFYCQIL